ncbi:hypothetical protein [Pseudomonas nunensis]|uniref:Lipoprotein n=1 Tax=Pseudomonas nunensis TaxID=2961896 RepID=A0ABY5EP65_9PSED|nr:hypothetical protein [Pseudomonas nunensis]MCL5228540.1 hypothetical protein [Pseudomonas nunensis]UTO16988.1 hypothetical protein NK667_11765 [Pseudomonas nunensis]
MSSPNFSNCLKSAFFLAFPLMGACSWAGQVAKDSAESATSYYGSESFTLVATTPANFGFTSKAQYAPRAGQDCKAYVSGLGGSVTRHQQKSDRIEVKNIEQTARFNIPTEYHIAGCVMDLTRVDTSVDGSYGPTPLDIGGDGGGISISNSTAMPASKSINSGEIKFRGICSWMFQLSVARIQKDGISKILSCTATDENWNVNEDRNSRGKPGGSLSRDSLAGKEVHLELRFSPEETPASDGKWQKFPNGWKPCLGKGINDIYGFCRGNTKDFRPFKMNGRECTIYPGCTE